MRKDLHTAVDMIEEFWRREFSQNNPSGRWWAETVDIASYADSTKQYTDVVADLTKRLCTVVRACD
jgi:hypothetical protein